ncbi:rubrerythrin family protein [Oscillatoria salina]|uniref:rubrerythrin family protein n=1 Tax=Oscillatoria salina TaxID=331517 RepID=UPI0013BC77B6|nr:rubrerythrin family protein [Oscillatoria salina]MBZ8180652.1 rubrerythrin [Oscillatoria salina IIICB1]NET89681.1 rubrerythrin [Kamptonema sp. SIO1D9]
MMSSLKLYSTIKKTGTWTILASLATLSVVSCRQPETPQANIESSPLETQEVSTQPDSPTLDNLQKAYNGESNAHVMYLAFANKADEEGYQKLASLFRAAAKAEEIHRDNHAKVIETMGALPKNTITDPQVKSTPENLKAAIKGESYERDTMYPEFISQAKIENNQAALQTLTYAQKAEAQHAQLYTEAKNNLDSWRTQTGPFYVCTISGETTIQKTATAECPAVEEGESYLEVN